jgi:hypothetical protein
MKSIFDTQIGNSKTNKMVKLLIYSTLLTSITFSCVDKNKASEHTDSSEFKTPKSLPLKFSEEKPLKWNITNLDTLPAPKTSYFNLDKLPSKDLN